jgi:hypothetical protein
VVWSNGLVNVSITGARSSLSFVYGPDFVANAVFRYFALIQLILADSAIFFNLRPLKRLEVWFKFHLLILNPERASTRGKVAIDKSAITSFTNYFYSEHIILTQNAVHGVTIPRVFLAGALPIT